MSVNIEEIRAEFLETVLLSKTYDNFVNISLYNMTNEIYKDAIKFIHNYNKVLNNKINELQKVLYRRKIIENKQSLFYDSRKVILDKDIAIMKFEIVFFMLKLEIYGDYIEYYEMYKKQEDI